VKAFGGQAVTRRLDHRRVSAAPSSMPAPTWAWAVTDTLFALVDGPCRFAVKGRTKSSHGLDVTAA